MSGYVVIDSSVAYKWFHQEDEGHVAEAVVYLWQSHNGAIELAAPDTLLVEIANALRNSRLQPDDTLDLIDAFGSLSVELHESNPQRLRSAAELSYRHGISVYDALFLALAQELDCPLVTADRRAFGSIESSVEIRLL